MGIIEDTHLPANGFSHLAIAFYVSFLVCEPIQTYFIQKYPAAKWLGANVILWGIVLSCNAAVNSYTSVVALRVLLGVFESVTAPNLIIITGMWYKRNEQVSRMGIWYQGTSIGPAVSSLASFGFLHYANSSPNASFKSWQILFLLYGLVTIAIGICVVLFLPDNPMKSRLSDKEKIHIINRVRGNQTGIENKRLKWKQVKEVFLDVHTWLIALIVISTNVPNGAVSSFQSIIISNFGYDDYQTLLLGIPSAAVAFVCVLGATWWAGKYNQRSVMIIALTIPTLLGGALMAWLPSDNKSGLLAGNYLTNTVGVSRLIAHLATGASLTPSHRILTQMQASLPLMYSWVTANYAGHSKKTTMSAIVLISFCLGNIVGPETFRAVDAPQYIPAKITIVAVLAAAILFAVVLDVLYMWENKKRDRAGHQDLPPDYELLDLTDKENRNFRYLL